VLALGGGLGVAALREALDGSVHGARELERLTRMAPLGIIPAILTPDEEKSRGRQRARLALATAGTFIALVVLAHFFVAPVDVLWFAALRRFGV
jgi:polysaccharide biosynthesis transport protein